MAGAIKIEREVLDASLGNLKKCSNSQVIELMTKPAKTLKELDGENEMVEKVYENCKAFQGNYNTFLQGVRAFMDESEKVLDLGDFLAKIDAGEVKAQDLEFQAKKIDTSAIIR